MNTPCLSIFSTYSICHHTIFIHSNAVLVYQTFKRKRAIADRGGAQAKYLEKVVAPDKSNSPLGVVAISPDPQNTPTLADSSPTTLVISDAPTQQTPTAANSMIMPVDIAPAVRRKTPIPAKSTPNPVAKSLFEPERAPIAANRTLFHFFPVRKTKLILLSGTLCASFLHGKIIPQTQNNFQSSSATYA